MSGCTFCKILGKKLPAHKIWEDEHYFAFLDINPINRGHTLLIPKSHKGYIFDLNDTEFGDLLMRAKYISEPLRQATSAKRIGVMVEGFAVPHIHVHLIPINTGHDLDPNKAKPSTNDELTEIAANIREAIGKAN